MPIKSDEKYEPRPEEPIAHPTTFGGRVKILRVGMFFTQRTLAEIIDRKLRKKKRGGGFSFTYLSKIENGKEKPPSVPVILAIAEILRADSDELLALAGKAPLG